MRWTGRRRPLPAVWCSPADRRRIVMLPVYAHTIRVGDVIRHDDAPRTVVDLRTLPGGRKHVAFSDGRAPVLGRTMCLEALRSYLPPDRWRTAERRLGHRG